MNRNSTQSFLQVQDIREGSLVLKDRSIRGVMMVSSQNFALKSGEEQDAILFQFQNFLNSLDFSLQIVSQSRRLNITGYLDGLKQLEDAQTNELLKQQTTSYRHFIKELVQGGAILTKNFYTVVPFSLIEALPDEGQKGILKRRPKIAGKLTNEEFKRMRDQLWQRMEFVALGLRRTGLKVIPLNSEELIELLWSWYHPMGAEVGYYPQVLPEMLERDTQTRMPPE